MGGPPPQGARSFSSFLMQRIGQVWLYHGGAPLPELLRPHGYKEHVEPLENVEHDELNSVPDTELISTNPAA